MFQAGKTKVGDAIDGIVKIFAIAVSQQALPSISCQSYAWMDGFYKILSKNFMKMYEEKY